MVISVSEAVDQEHRQPRELGEPGTITSVRTPFTHSVTSSFSEFHDFISVIRLQERRNLSTLSNQPEIFGRNLLP